MPLPIAHGLLGASLVALIYPKDEVKNWKPLFGGFALAIAPDFDFAFVFLFGWEDFHRGITHSLFFAFLVGAAIFALLKDANRRVALAYSLAFLSHSLLDYAATAQTKGVRLLAPFENGFYKLNLISFSELPNGFVLSEMLRFSAIEALIFVPFFLLILFIRKFI
jgi:inner membrane protein